MPSSHNELGTELMVTGEKSGQWGTITNTNWNIIQMAVAGYSTQVVADGTTTALAITDGSVVAADNVARNMIIKLTSSGALTGTSTVTVPDSVEKLYLVNNATTGSQTITFKTASGTGVNFTSTGYKLLFSDGTNVVDTAFGVSTSPGGSTTEIQFNTSGAFDGDANLYWDSTGLNIGTSKEIRLQDNTGGQYIGQKAADGTVNYTVTWPGAAASSNDQILTSTTGGVLSWVDNSGGTAWQAVHTSATLTAVAGNGYFIDTTSNVCNVTLPAGVLGDEVSLVDYAGTFDSNTLTVTPGSGEKIQGNTADAVLTNSTERAAFTLAYSGASQGWLLKNN